MPVFVAALAIQTGEPLDFSRDVRPILARHCLVCHGPDASSRKSGLRLDDPHSALAPREDGAAIVASHAVQSQLIARASSSDPDQRMPPADRPAISPAELAVLTRWIDEGAKYGRHWSWEPVKAPEIPQVRDAQWCQQELDSFVLAELEERGIAPAGEADRATLLRRLSFDLIGLPPSADEVAAFAADTRPEAYEEAVERLLASEHFGERWGRHWLDLVRYAETYGHEFDYSIDHAWRYRDYVIRAFNTDVPFDRLVQEHVAGDLLSAPRIDPATGVDESPLGTGFWCLTQGTHGPVDVRQDELDRIDNQIDVFSRAFLGTTMACARCHDHKFDPIPSSDYYALVGMLRSSRRHTIYLDPGGQLELRRAEILEQRRQLEAQLSLDTPAESAASSAGDAAIEEFAEAIPAGWSTTGQAFARSAGEVSQIGLSADGVLVRSPSGVASSEAVAPAMQGTLRSADFRIDCERIVIRACGTGCRVQATIDGYSLHQQNPVLFEHVFANCESPDTWIDLKLDVSRYQGEQAYLEFIDDGPGWIMIDSVRRETGATSAASATSPPRTPLVELSPGLATDLASRLAQVVEPASIGAPLRAQGLLEGTASDEPVLNRGNHRTPGVTTPRAAIDSVPVGDLPATGSGRLALAMNITSSASPLLARVMANRIWQHLIGVGLSATSDDFGSMGTPPGNPALLERLAAEFQSDWSVKNLVRHVVLSSTYRMSSRASDPRAEEIDPLNEIPHRGRLRRLDAECIRDAILTNAGTLDPAVGGPPVAIHLTDSMPGRGRPAKSGPLDGDRRRSIYLEVRRNFPAQLLAVFDQPIPTTTVGLRNESNVPAQSLALANDPFVRAQAAAWGTALSGDAARPSERVARMIRSAFGRDGNMNERSAMIAALNGRNADPAAWQELALALFNAKEFVLLP